MEPGLGSEKEGEKQAHLNSWYFQVPTGASQVPRHLISPELVGWAVPVHQEPKVTQELQQSRDSLSLLAVEPQPRALRAPGWGGGHYPSAPLSALLQSCTGKDRKLPHG